MVWILIAACIAVIVFGVRLFQIKRQLRGITSQLNDRTDEKTEKKLTVSLIDGNLNELTAAINRNLDLQKKVRIDVRSSDLQLKDSIANLSHDLRTPLTSILGYLQLARNPHCPADKQGEYLKVVNDKANALKAMINSLYELSILDVKEMPLKKEKLDLTLITTDILAGQYELFQKSGIELKVNLPAHPVWIIGDRLACTRVIQNLLNNTTRYAKGNAEIFLENSGSYAVLSIRNPAPNLMQEDMEHLFERFYTADKSRSNSGSGLGLYIVKTLLTKMGGEIMDVSLTDQTLCIKVGFWLQ